MFVRLDNLAQSSGADAPALLSDMDGEIEMDEMYCTGSIL